MSLYPDTQNNYPKPAGNVANWALYKAVGDVDLDAKNINGIFEAHATTVESARVITGQLDGLLGATEITVGNNLSCSPYNVSANQITANGIIASKETAGNNQPRVEFQDITGFARAQLGWNSIIDKMIQTSNQIKIYAPAEKYNIEFGDSLGFLNISGKAVDTRLRRYNSNATALETDLRVGTNGTVDIRSPSGTQAGIYFQTNEGVLAKSATLNWDSSANEFSMKQLSGGDIMLHTNNTITLRGSEFKMNALTSSFQSNILGYDTTTHKITYQPLPTTPLTGMSCTGGDSTTTFIQNGVQYTAHVFTTVGSSTFTINSFGTSKNPTIDILMIGGGGSGGRGDGTNIYGGGAGAGGYVLIQDLPLINNATLPQTIQTVLGAGGASRTTSGTGNTGNPTYIIIPDVLNITNTNLTIDTGTSAGGGGGTTNPTSTGQATYFWQTQNGVTVPTTVRYSGAGGGTASGTGAGVTRQNTWFNTSGTNAGRCGETITAGGFGGGLGSTSANFAGAGGGGIRSLGADSTGQSRSGGGVGIVTYFDGTCRMIGGGGMGAGQQSGSAPGINNGLIFGGGVGQWVGGGISASDGLANTGSGGGGSFNGNSGAGGSGLLIIRYRS